MTTKSEQESGDAISDAANRAAIYGGSRKERIAFIVGRIDGQSAVASEVTSHDLHTLISRLRNPWGLSHESLKRDRLAAADAIEALYRSRDTE